MPSWVILSTDKQANQQTNQEKTGFPWTELNNRTNNWHISALDNRAFWRTVWQLTRLFNIFEVRKPLSHRRTNVAHGQDIGDGEVAHDGASKFATFSIISVNHGWYEHGHATGPRQWVELLPVSTDHQRHIEAKDESNWDAVTGLVAEFSYRLEVSTV